LSDGVAARILALAGTFCTVEAISMDDAAPPSGDEGEGKRPTAPTGAMSDCPSDMAGANDEAVLIRLSRIQQEHSDLDAAISALEAQPHCDRLAVARLKKKKLQLKDIMHTLKDQLTPDIIA
jgi:hypothetical protein